MRASPIEAVNSVTHGPAATRRLDRFCFLGYVVDRTAWSVRWQEVQIVLSPKSFDLLLYLMDHCDRVVCKDELLKELWPRQIVEESNLSQHVFLLRKALSRHANGAKLIETVVGRGYRFIASLEAAPVQPPRATVDLPQTPVRHLERSVSAMGPWSSRIALATAMFVLGVSAGHYWQVRAPRPLLQLSLSRSDQSAPTLANIERQTRRPPGGGE